MGDYDNARIWAVQGFEGGLISNYPKHSLEGDASPDCENNDPSVRFSFKKRLGTSNFSGDHGSPTGTAVNGFGIFTFENGTTKILAKEGTAVYDVTAGNWSTTLSGYTPADGHKVYMTMFKNVVVFTSSAYIAPLKWSGSGALASLGGSPPSALYSCSHKARLFLLGTSADPSRWYCSATSNHEDWSTADNAGNDYINPGDGNVINGAASDGEFLYVSKQAVGGEDGAMYVMHGDSPTNFAVKRAAYFGAVSQRCFIATPHFVCFAAPDGIYAIQGRDLSLLSDPVNDQWQSLTAAQRAAATMGYFHDQIWIAYPASGSTNTKVLVLDVLSQRWTRYSFPAHCAPGIMATHADGTLYAGGPSTTIRVVKYNTGATDIGSTAITSYWKTPDLDFGAWFTDKRVKSFRLHANSSQTVTWTVDRYVNGTDTSDPVTMAAATDGPIKRFQGKNSDTRGRFVQFKISEASTTAQSEMFGFEADAELYPSTV